MKNKYIWLAVILFVVAALWYKFGRKPKDEGEQATDKAPPQGDSSDSPSPNGSDSSQTSPAADTKKKLTQPQVTEIQRQINERLKAVGYYAKNPSEAARVLRVLLPTSPTTQRRLLEKLNTAATNKPIVEDGKFGAQTQKAFLDVFGKNISIYSDYATVAQSWQSQSSKAGQEQLKQDLGLVANLTFPQIAQTYWLAQNAAKIASERYG
jgi:hypothetical protein